MKVTSTRRMCRELFLDSMRQRTSRASNENRKDVEESILALCYKANLAVGKQNIHGDKHAVHYLSNQQATIQEL